MSASASSPSEMTSTRCCPGSSPAPFTPALPVGVRLVSVAARPPRRGRARVRADAAARSGRPLGARGRCSPRCAAASHGATESVRDRRSRDRSDRAVAREHRYAGRFASRRTTSADDLHLDVAGVGIHRTGLSAAPDLRAQALDIDQPALYKTSLGSGRIAQRKSIALTRRWPQVRTLLRPLKT